MPHLLIDLHGCRRGLRSIAATRRLLGELARASGMTAISAPQARRLEEGGVAGFVIIAESHISAHTAPQSGRAWVDVFSCKEFERGALMGAVRACYEPTSVEVRWLDRGDLAADIEVGA